MGLLVWAHGGSWQRGSAAEWHHSTAALAAWSGWSVISVDYRLAPRHRHPSAVQDILTALAWACGEAAGLPLAVGGDSAGGTLAASAALAARDRGLPLAAQVLAYPPFDPTCAGPSYHRSPSAFPQTGPLRQAWRAWRGDGSGAVHHAGGTRLYTTHREARTLAGVAPAVLVVGPDDPVHDDVEAYAHRLREDGVPVRLLRPPGAVHGDVLRPDRPLLPLLARALRMTARRTAKGLPMTVYVPPAPLEALVRHFVDLRDGTHAGHASRQGKRNAFRQAAELLDVPVRQVLAEFDRHLLLGTGAIEASGPRADAAGGSLATWSLSWPTQRAAGIAPITLIAHYGAGFHHPHLRGATVGEWPLNVMDARQAAELVPALRAIAAADLHNLVFQRDWRIVPAIHP
ncbi:MAG: alpha/beta hydrolase fold domain-containing protein [Streptomyces sp.]|nr:alpha/beta hydrolase fold domain-containing protein [Streptomyces sp.]